MYQANLVLLVVASVLSVSIVRKKGIKISINRKKHPIITFNVCPLQAWLVRRPYGRLVRPTCFEL